MMIVLAFVTGFLTATSVAIFMILFNSYQTGRLEESQTVLEQSLFESDLPVRVQNALRWAEIYTVGDVIKHERKHFLKFRGFGKTSLLHLESFIEKQGVEWK
jgi:DNA-directed RNA polymerase alpha subunit